MTGVSLSSTATSAVIAACTGERPARTPIWLMRQAGRYLPEYRELRARYSMLEMVRTPELAAKVTLQPLERFDLDAAIIFSDILPPLNTLGLNLEFIKGEGPLIDNPVRSARDVERLCEAEIGDVLPFTCEAIKLVRTELGERSIPVIGFTGAPFTLAAYAIEGGPSRNLARVKAFMLSEPVAWDRLMTKLAELAGENLRQQAAAGAEVLQIFDSWCGELAPVDYRAFALPYSRRVIEIAKTTGVPVIHFGTGTSGFLADLRELGADVIGIDWRIDLATAREILGADTGIQGNLDPVTLFAPAEIVERRAQEILDQAAGADRFIFNLGHGILPETPIENVARLVDYVHSVPPQ
jgi:uroporphyrinogen decarboxylase